jgi:uncharacterized C2H2 Zn-finger protein
MKTIQIGDKFNDWEVVSGPFFEDAKEKWDLKCTRCSKIYRYDKRYIIRSNFSKACRSCSQLKRNKETGKFRIGEKFQNLTILSEPKLYKGNSYYKVKCDCGHIFRTGHSTLSSKSKENSKSLPYCRACFSVDKRAKKRNTMVSDHISQTCYHKIHKQANDRGIKFNVTPQDLEDLLIAQDFKCALSGIKLQLSLNFQKKEDREYHTASLDRIDSTKPYEKGNIQWVHKDINYMKCDFTQKEFLNYCQLIVNNKLISSQAQSTLCEGSETT